MAARRVGRKRALTLGRAQVGVCNSDQAAKGSMLKIKKIMPAMRPSVLGHAISTLPSSLTAFDDNMDSYRTAYPAISRVLYPGNTKFVSCTPESSAYSNYDEAADGFVLCDVGGGMSEIFVSTKLVVDALACSDVTVCQKLLDVIMSTGALQVPLSLSLSCSCGSRSVR